MTSRQRLWPILSVAVLISAAGLGAWSLWAARKTADMLQKMSEDNLRKDARLLAGRVSEEVDKGIRQLAARHLSEEPREVSWRGGQVVVRGERGNDPDWVTNWMVLNSDGRLLNPAFRPPYLAGDKASGAEPEPPLAFSEQALKVEKFGEYEEAGKLFLQAADEAVGQPALRWQALAAAAANRMRAILPLRQKYPARFAQLAREAFDDKLWEVGEVARVTNPTVVQMKVFLADALMLQGSHRQSARTLLDLARDIIEGQEFCADEDEEEWVFSRVERAVKAIPDADQRREHQEQFKQLRGMRDLRRDDLRFYRAEWLRSPAQLLEEAKDKPIGEKVSGERVAILAAAAEKGGPPNRLVVCRLNMAVFIQQVIEPLRSSMPRRDDLKVNEVLAGMNPFFRLPDPFGDYSLEMTADAAANIRRQVKRSQYLVGSGVVALAASLMGGLLLLIHNLQRQMELTRLKSEFVANVSHELKTPLALIRMFGETLRDRRVKNEEKAQEYYGIIVRESERLTRLINNILDFAKIEAGKKQYTFAPTNLAAVVSETVESYSHALKQSGFQTSVEIGPDLPATLADGEAISQAVLNLINNAVKYSPTNKELNVRTWAENGELCIAVADRGIGIAPQDQQRIFEGFYRVPSEAVRAQRGTGLGLTLVRHIVAAHSGTIGLQSQLGVGSTFTIRLPVRQAPAAVQPELAETA